MKTVDVHLEGEEVKRSYQKEEKKIVRQHASENC